MDERASVKEVVSGLIGMFGFFCLFCEADGLLSQALIATTGIVLIGLAYLVWCIWTAKEVNHDD